MSIRTWQKNISLVLSLGCYGTAGVASDFLVNSDFMAAQLPEIKEAPPLTASGLTALEPQSLDQLMAKVKGRKEKERDKALPSQKPSLPQPKEAVPAILVQSPRTGGELVKVEIASKAAHDNEEEIFAEARRFLDADLPPATGKRPIVSQIGEGERLVLQSRGEQLEIEPKAAHLQLGGQPLQIVYEGLAEQPQIFLRDSKRLRWDDKTRQLYGQALGHSEVFITYRNQMYILPVQIQEKSRPALLSQDQKSLQRLTSILPLKETSLTFQNPSASASSGRREVAEGEESIESAALSLSTSAAEVSATRTETEQKRQRFVYPSASPDYKTIAVQVLDERSVPEQGLIYPVSGVKVRLLGTPVVAQTDAKGHALFGEIPAGSRFWTLIEDDKGQIVPTVAELALPRNGKQEVLRARTMSFRTFSAYMNIVDLAQDAQLGSLCGRTMQEDGRQPLEDVRVSINVDADGPYYIGNFGPQKDLDSTNKSGRFCFFNVRAGLAELSFFKGKDYVTAASLPIFPGAHSDEDLYLGNSQGRKLYLASLPNAMEQVYEDQASQDLFQAVDAIDLIAIGENEAMARISPGVIGHESGYTNFKGRIYALSQAPEFENVLYALDRDKEWTRHMPVVPLLQRGFIEDLFHELNQQDNYSGIAFDPALGQALVYHALEAGQAGVKISLINNAGQAIEEAWYFGNPAFGTSKAVFFNLQAGVYQVKVESSQGALLALDTLAVDYWTTALVQTGSSAQLNLGFRREDD